MTVDHQILEHSVTEVDYTLFHVNWVPSSPRSETFYNFSVVIVYNTGQKRGVKLEGSQTPHFLASIVCKMMAMSKTWPLNLNKSNSILCFPVVIFLYEHFVSRFVTCGSSLAGEGFIKTYGLASKGVNEVSSCKRKKAIRCGTFESSSLEDRYYVTGDFGGNISGNT